MPAEEGLDSRRPVARRCRVHGTVLDPLGACVLCRRRSTFPPERRASTLPPPKPSRRRAWALVALGAVLITGAAVTALQLSPPADASPARTTEQAATSPEAASDAAPEREEEAPSAAEPALAGALQTTNGSGRAGAYFVPSGRGPAGRGFPLLVAFHGSGGDGRGILAAFKSEAVRRGFAIVAPDSSFIQEAGTATWYVAHEAGDAAPDQEHIERSIQEVLARAGTRIARSGWLAVGHSGGASTAPYVATHDQRFSAFAVLHGGAFPRAFGPYRPRGWFSTGEADPARPPAHVTERAAAARAVLGATNVELHLFPGGHEVSTNELNAALDHWLGR